MSSQQNIRGLRSGLTLEFPQSLGVYDKYEQAQRAVDFLSDHEFPVENCMIVGSPPDGWRSEVCSPASGWACSSA